MVSFAFYRQMKTLPILGMVAALLVTTYILWKRRRNRREAAEREELGRRADEQRRAEELQRLLEWEVEERRELYRRTDKQRRLEEQQRLLEREAAERQELDRRAEQRRLEEQQRFLEREAAEREEPGRRADEQRRLEELQRVLEQKAAGRPAPDREPTRFYALWPRPRASVWQSLLIYITTGLQGLSGAQSDSRRRRTGSAKAYEESSSVSRHRIRRGTKISVHPDMAGFQFNPPFADVLWLEDWHCIEFRMRASAEAFTFEGRIEGRVGFYVGPILIAETELYVYPASTARDADHDRTAAPIDDSIWYDSHTSPYRAIFVSYSHEDSSIVDHLELAYSALGDEYLRDIAVLRSGQMWNPALLAQIDRADIFQLCWSESARLSKYVEQEWRHALSLCRPSFIRPMYWRVPMPAPPKELKDLHFAYVRFDDDKPASAT
jgi:hypothetical protein